jgi:hypothetical protein
VRVLPLTSLTVVGIIGNNTEIGITLLCQLQGFLPEGSSRGFRWLWIQRASGEGGGFSRADVPSSWDFNIRFKIRFSPQLNRNSNRNRNNVEHVGGDRASNNVWNR